MLTAQSFSFNKLFFKEFYPVHAESLKIKVVFVQIPSLFSGRCVKALETVQAKSLMFNLESLLLVWKWLDYIAWTI